MKNRVEPVDRRHAHSSACNPLDFTPNMRFWKKRGKAETKTAEHPKTNVSNEEIGNGFHVCLARAD